MPSLVPGFLRHATTVRAAPESGFPLDRVGRCRSRTTPPSLSALDVIREVVLRALLVPRAEIHPTARTRVLTCATRDGELARAGIEERPLDDDLASGEERRPPALPGVADLRSDAIAVVAADLLGVPRVVE